MSDTAVDALELSLRALSVSSGTAPVVRFARLNAGRCEVYLAGPAVLPAPWSAINDELWSVDVAALPAVTGTSVYPGMLLLGSDEEGGHVLLNAECTGGLILDGEDLAVREVLAGLVTDAALAGWSESLTITLVGVFPDLESELGSGRIRFAASPGELVALPVAGPELVVLAAAIPATDEAAVRERLAHPGVIVVCDSKAEAVAPGSWRLRLDARGSHEVAVLEPVGLQVYPQRLPAGNYGHLLQVVSFAADDSAFMPTPDVHLPAGGPELLLLGPVDIINTGGPVEPNRRARLVELAAFIALHPGCSGPQIDEAVWPSRSGQDNTNTRHTAMSKLRRWLGKDIAGEPFLPGNPSARTFGFAAAVTSDVDRWTRLVGDDPRAVSTPRLVEALDLVRGAPFEGVGAKYYQWAEPLKHELIAQITDAFEELADRHAEAGQWREANQVACRGLRIEPGDERLWRIRLQAAGHTRQRAAVDEVAAQLHEMQSSLGDLDPETIEVLEGARAAVMQPGPVVQDDPVDVQPAVAVVPAAVTPHVSAWVDGDGADSAAGEGLDQVQPVGEPPAVALVELEPVEDVEDPAVVVLPAAPAVRRFRPRVLAAAGVVMVAGSGGLWLAVQPSSDLPVAAAPQPITPPPAVSPADTAAVRAKPVHPRLVPATVTWQPAAAWARRKQIAEQRARQRAVFVQTPYVAPGTAPVTGGAPVSTWTPTNSGSSSGGGGTAPSSSGGGNSGGAGGVVVRPDPVSQPAAPALPDMPADPTDPDGR